MRIFQRLAAVEGESPELPQNRSTELKGICLKYATAPCSVAICLALRLPLVSVMGPKAPYITFFPGVIFTAWYGGLGPGLLATFLSVLAAGYFFIPSFHSLPMRDSTDTITAASFLAISTLLCILIKALRRSRARNEERIRQLAVETARRALAEEFLERQISKYTDQLQGTVLCTFALNADGTSGFPYTSRGIVDLLGIDREALKQDAAHLFSLIHPEDRASFHATIESSAKTMAPWRMEFRIHHVHKGERWIEGQATPALDDGGSIVWHGFKADITERKRLESDQRFLHELGARMQASSSPESIAELAMDAVADHFDLSRSRLSAVSVSGNELTLLHESSRRGYSPSLPGTCPLSGSPFAPLIAALESGTAIAIADTESDSSTASGGQTAFRLLDAGAMIAVPLRREGQWVAVLTLIAPERREWSRREIDLARAAAERIWPAYEVARSLTAERAMLLTLTTNEERLRLALQSSAIGIWEQNPETKEIRWDDRAEEIFGFSGFDGGMEAAMSCIHPDDRLRVYENAAAYHDPAGDGRFDMEFRIFTKDTGSLRYIYDRGLTFFSGEGANRRAVRSIGTLQDITALKEKERELEAANRELEEFAYVASHDLKAPLRVIDNCSKWIEEDLEEQLSGDARENMNLLRGRVKRMEKLLDDLLEYARIGNTVDARAPELIAGDALVHHILEMLAPSGFNIHVSPNFSRIQVRAMPLQQILMNLIGNAIKHHDKKTGSIEVTVEEHGRHYSFAVKDDGPGIHPRFHQQIFKMFQTLRPRDLVEGSGMGLAMVRKHVEFAGGTMHLESAEGKGSTFRFTWPMQEPIKGEAVEQYGYAA